MSSNVFGHLYIYAKPPFSEHHTVTMSALILAQLDMNHTPGMKIACSVAMHGYGATAFTPDLLAFNYRPDRA